MAWFRRRSPQVIRKGVGADGVVEERKTRRVGGEVVEVRRVRTPAPAEKPTRKPTPQPSKKKPSRSGNGQRRRPVEEEIILPPEVARKQMLVRVLPHQTQIVVLEGAMLVEHYLARSDAASLVGNVYLGRVKNVLPGMEAAFVDFGAAKNGVVYAADIGSDRGRHGRRHPRIEDSLSEGDDILVQVAKDAMGAKGARLTGQVSLPGRYLVLVPDSDAQGISRRLPDDERQRLREIVEAVKPSEFGVIVRTAAQGASKEEIATDIERLVHIWEGIRKEAEAGPVPRLIYREPELLIRVIREHFTPDFRRLLIDDQESHARVVSYLQETAPDLVDKVQRYQDEMGVFERFHVEDQLRKALDRKVWLPSGGHLVIDRTEALTVIDVNTGKFVGSSSLEDTVGDGKPTDVARTVGKRLAERAQEAGIATAVFDRNGYRYHGRVQAVAEGAREGGLRV